MPRVTRPKPLLVHAATLARGRPVVMYCRVSEYTQVSKGSLEAQKQFVLTEVRALGLPRRAFVYGREHGKLSEDRPHLQYAIKLARECCAGIVAADLTRLLRSEAFDKVTNRMAVPTPEEIEALLALAEGVPFLATIADPLLTPSDLHSLAVMRGMQAKDNPGGRPKRIRYARGICILADHDRGLSLGKIAEKNDVPKTTVDRFIKKWKTIEAWRLANQGPSQKD